MDYNIQGFITTAKERCKTKADLVKRIDNEIAEVDKIKLGQFHLQRKAYRRDLENLKHTVRFGAFPEQSDHDEEIISLLDGLK